MKIQGNLINNYNYNKLNFNVTSSKEDKKAADYKKVEYDNKKVEYDKRSRPL